MLCCTGRGMLYLRLATQLSDVRLLGLHARMRSMHMPAYTGQQACVVSLLVALLVSTEHELLLGVEQALSRF